MKKSKTILKFLLLLVLVLSTLCVPAFALDESEVEAAVSASSKEAVTGNVLIWFLCAVAFLKVSQKVDSFMASLGVNVGHTGGSMLSDAMLTFRAVTMATGGASRILGGGQRGTGASGAGTSSSGGSGSAGVGGFFKGGLIGMAGTGRVPELPAAYPQDCEGGRPLKIVDQTLFDKATEQGFPPNFFRETYFDQVTLYCLPEHADFYGSTFQGCVFAVCRINAASFIGTSIYSSEFHSCVLEHTDFFKATLANTHFHDCSLVHITFQTASLKSCNTIDCTLDHINYLTAKLDACSFGRVTASDIRNLTSATITQGGATAEECCRNRENIFQALGVEQEAL